MSCALEGMGGEITRRAFTRNTQGLFIAGSLPDQGPKDENTSAMEVGARKRAHVQIQSAGEHNGSADGYSNDSNDFGHPEAIHSTTSPVIIHSRPPAHLFSQYCRWLSYRAAHADDYTGHHHPENHLITCCYWGRCGFHAKHHNMSALSKRSGESLSCFPLPHRKPTRQVTTVRTAKAAVMLAMATAMLLVMMMGFSIYFSSRPSRSESSVVHPTPTKLLPETLHDVHPKPTATTPLPAPFLLHVGQFGLGHRFSKLSAAVHLAFDLLSLDRVQVHWGSCQRHGRIRGNDTALDIFSALFGGSNWIHRKQLLADRGDANSSWADPYGKIVERNDNDGAPMILVRNDVAGYYAGQSYKNAQVPIPKHFLDDDCTNRNRHHNVSRETKRRGASPQHTSSSLPHSPWEEKMEMDGALFRNLLHERFTLLHERKAFQRLHDWHRRTVVGVHIRAGNGETSHFKQSARGHMLDISSAMDTVNKTTSDQLEIAMSTWTQQVCELLRRLVDDFPRVISENTKAPKSSILPPLVFLATDTPHLIPMVREACQGRNGIPVVEYPQPRLQPGQGVSYQQWKSGHDRCMAGWQSSIMDMALLSEADVVVAVRRSTFTQIAPLAMVFSRSTPAEGPEDVRRHGDSVNKRFGDNTPFYKYCEMNDAADHMSCFATRQAWLCRRIKVDQTTGLPTIWNISLLDDGENSSKSTGAAEKRLLKSTFQIQENLKSQQVVHKLMVHLPDIDRDSVIDEAQKFLKTAPSKGSNVSRVFVYGDIFATKYRNSVSVVASSSLIRPDWTMEGQ